jgi:hypothetical protein
MSGKKKGYTLANTENAKNKIALMAQTIEGLRRELKSTTELAQETISRLREGLEATNKLVATQDYFIQELQSQIEQLKREKGEA